MKALLPVAFLLLPMLTHAPKAQLDAFPPDTAAARREAMRQHSLACYRLRQAQPCPYAKEATGPACVDGHTDHIIPVIYGLVGDSKVRKKEKRGEVLLGGCFVSDCDPHYYCTVHKQYL